MNSYYYYTLTKFPVKQTKELGDNLAHVDCADVASEAIDKVIGSLHCNHFNDSLKGMMSNTLE